MIRPVLVDTGPLVAIFSRADGHHSACVDQLRDLAPPLFTCWPVITEAAWLLRQHPGELRQLLGSFGPGLLEMLELDQQAIPAIAAFLARYRNIGAQVADAALVYLAERDGIEAVFTLDRHDFSIYRTTTGRSLHLLPAL